MVETPSKLADLPSGHDKKETNVEEDTEINIEGDSPDMKMIDPESDAELDVGSNDVGDLSEQKIGQIKERLKTLREQTGEARRKIKSADKKQKKILAEQLDSLNTEEKELRLALETETRLAEVSRLVHGPSAEELQAQKAAVARAKKQAKNEARKQAEIQKTAQSHALASLLPNLGRLERNSFERILYAEGLAIHNIEPDGNCLFASLSHQLRVRHSLDLDQQTLRSLAAEHIRKNRDKYSAFIDTDEPLEDYCLKLRSGELWGGHLELDALQEALNIPIIVYQADGAPLRFGLVDGSHNNEPLVEKSPLRICFQRYAYSLGEHYDSLTDDQHPHK